MVEQQFVALEPWMMAMIFVFVLWSFIWKGWALWRAAKNDSKPWFIILLFVNTVGILEILYIFVFGKTKSTPAQAQVK